MPYAFAFSYGSTLDPPPNTYTSLRSRLAPNRGARISLYFLLFRIRIMPHHIVIHFRRLWRNPRPRRLRIRIVRHPHRIPTRRQRRRRLWPIIPLHWHNVSAGGRMCSTRIPMRSTRNVVSMCVGWRLRLPFVRRHAGGCRRSGGGCGGRCSARVWRPAGRARRWPRGIPARTRIRGAPFLRAGPIAEHVGGGSGGCGAYGWPGWHLITRIPWGSLVDFSAPVLGGDCIEARRWLRGTLLEIWSGWSIKHVFLGLICIGAWRCVWLPLKICRR